jgi:hypothetical protein
LAAGGLLQLLLKLQFRNVLRSNAPPSDAAFETARTIYPLHTASSSSSRALLSERDKLLAQLLQLQREHTQETFYPDANGCLRLSAGHVEVHGALAPVQFCNIMRRATLQQTP